ncbi:hypothetical protein MKW98_012827 [Papaver atlanticum]|uniref:Uncharacterized protein n=1 Tax=Papaver atlanticum TaxID=357466 RepID=A0AAD4SME4_9MAGN|nr:hypothetical protein MKW98_012827 [Papaver atlanticum]
MSRLQVLCGKKGWMSTYDLQANLKGALKQFDISCNLNTFYSSQFVSWLPHGTRWSLNCGQFWLMKSGNSVR